MEQKKGKDGKVIITVLPMEQKKGKDGKASFCVCVFVKEGKRENRRKERKRARSSGTDWPPLRTLLLFSYSVSVKRIPLSRAHEKEKKKKKKKKKKLRTNGRKGEKERKKKRLLLHGGGDESVEGLALGGELLHLDEESDTVADELEELDLGVADTVSVGHVIGAVGRGGVDTTGTTLLETEEVQDLVELLLVLGQVWELDVDAGTKTSSQVGWAGQDVAEMLVPHVRVAALLHQGLDLGKTLAEASEDTLDITTLLHGDNAEMILLVDPDEEGLGVVVPDTAAVGPVAGHAGAGEEGRDGLVEEEVIGDQLI